jgi:hypothetical protein
VRFHRSAIPDGVTLASTKALTDPDRRKEMTWVGRVRLLRLSNALIL